jgi:hypothetical protein
MALFDAPWLPRLLFRVTLVAAAGLLILVLGAPVLHPHVSSRFVATFAQDSTLRRTALASAIGLTVTACVFFRSAPVPTRVAPKPRGKLPPPPDLAGA